MGKTMDKTGLVVMKFGGTSVGTPEAMAQVVAELVQGQSGAEEGSLASQRVGRRPGWRLPTPR